MGNEADPPAEAVVPGFPVATPGLELRPNGVLIHDDLPVGTLIDGLITLNLGWCRLADLSVVVEDDPQHDRHRDGLALNRRVGRNA